MRRISHIERFIKNPHDVQEQLLLSIVKKARNTEWGKKHDYKSIKNLQQLKERVPVSPYEKIYPYIERMMMGEKDILWPSPITWFSKSSGTTNAKSKFIPVSKDALFHCHYKGGKDLLCLYFHNKPDSKLFEGKGLGIGGTYNANKKWSNSYYGDVSAVIMANLPMWAQFVRTPSLKIALMDEWEEKIERMARATLNEKVTNISGVPTWSIVLLERILEITGKSNILEVWPEFEVFYHGAVAFGPYKDIFKKFFPSDKVMYLETYNASEGFFGIQDDLSIDHLLLMLDYGIYYEFIPMEEEDKEFPKTISLDQVQLNTNYAMVISTNAGLWRYKIGDTVKFTSLSPYRIKISGRTKHFINAFGEELIVENAETALAEACKRTGATATNFTAGPVYFEGKSRGGHEWIIEFSDVPLNMENFSVILDEELKKVNSDYEAKRHKDLALQKPIVHSVPSGTFYNWMKKRGKLGGQNKVPRLSNNREYLEDILKGLQLIQ
ncbi:MAG: GH3 auxin-responsive promoter family protein [Cytophagaceae bacterium]